MKVVILGSGPIRIGQAAEFDYSGSQASLALREEGIETVIVNSNPATIQTDTDVADRVYIEPLTPRNVADILRIEKPDGIIASMGGQTALNLAMELHERGVLDELGIEVMGTPIRSMVKGGNRSSFNQLMRQIGEPILRGEPAETMEEAKKAAERIGYPVIIRPAFTLGGSGGGIAANEKKLEKIVERGLAFSRIHQVLVEESVYGWGEFEYEVVRDGKDNCIVVCTMENLDPCGVHTGESIVVAPAQTLSDKDHQMLRAAAIRIIRSLGIEGGCNIQFALNEETGEYRVIEVNTRLSRSSALASKATGYPIARISAKIAMGKSLDQIKNPITETSAFYEPALDYVVVKIPRWPFDKVDDAETAIGTQMKSTGEVMAISRSFEGALHKAIRSLDLGFGSIDSCFEGDLEKTLENPTHMRLFAIREALKKMSVERVAELTNVNPWFLEKVKGMEKEGGDKFKMVDTCAGEFVAKTPYYYSTAGSKSDLRKSKKRKVIVLGGGPIRIAQGVEFDYCCVHAALELRRLGFEAVMVNNNPETVSTDFDTSDRLYFEPLTPEHVNAVIEAEDPLGTVVQFGGQTSINIAHKLKGEVLGTSLSSIDLAEDRKKFSRLLSKLGIPQPEGDVAHGVDEARRKAEKLGYPLLLRPSYVIGGRGMRVVKSGKEFERYVKKAVKVTAERPLLMDRFVEGIECETDAVRDGEKTLIGGIMEHIEPSGVHSGDASCVTPHQSLHKEKEAIVDYTERIAEALGIVGLVNIQFIASEGDVYVIEANPRASRTIPFLSKATGVPLAKLATRAMTGVPLERSGLVEPKAVAVKSVVFPFQKLQGADFTLGPEMKSTGESMGIARTYPAALYKALLGADFELLKGNALLSVKSGGRLRAMLERDGWSTEKAVEGSEKRIREGKIQLVVATTRDGKKLRRAAVEHSVPCLVNEKAAEALLTALREKERIKPVSINELLD